MLPADETVAVVLDGTVAALLKKLFTDGLEAGLALELVVAGLKVEAGAAAGALIEPSALGAEDSVGPGGGADVGSLILDFEMVIFLLWTTL